MLALAARRASRHDVAPDAPLPVARGPVGVWRDSFVRRPELAYERARRVVESALRARYHVSPREALALAREGRLALAASIVSLLSGGRPPLAELADALEALQ
ncbi:MAG: hypothetical protein ACYDCK_08825 [Thermoplasmatota archaeon]